jgi:hypothetical protein|tara:strand:+ start:755 stop:862 length:108 start_codon:yes stop_codon:yes gene_type:complete
MYIKESMLQIEQPGLIFAHTKAALCREQEDREIYF